MQILVTGGAGFIGSHLVEWLVSQAHRVRVLDNFSSGRRERLEALGGSIELIEGDIRDLAVVQEAAAGVERIFHLAAMVSVGQSIEQPLEAEAINGMGSLHVLEAARSAGVTRVVLASTCAVYGNTERLPVAESEPPDPLSPYAATKLAAEYLGRLYSRLYETEAVSLRFFNVYGPRQDPASPYAAVVPRFIAAMRSGRQPVIHGDGRQSRDFVFIDDVVRAMWVAATAPNIAGGVFNVGRGEAQSILELAQTLGELLGVEVSPTFTAARRGEVRHSRADVTLFEQRASFRARVGLREGLAATLAAL